MADKRDYYEVLGRTAFFLYDKLLFSVAKSPQRGDTFTNVNNNLSYQGLTNAFLSVILTVLIQLVQLRRERYGAS